MKISVRHYPDRPAPPPPSMNHLSPSGTDDMNATLLKSNEATNEDPIKRDLFGNFKGFSLKPLPMSKPNIVGASNVAFVHPVAKTDALNEQCVPSRAAPVPPTDSPKKSQAKSSAIVLPKSSPSSFRYQNVNASPKNAPETPIEVKLFATKSDAKERPKISNPVLENSTCSVKELVATANAKQVTQNQSNTLPKNNNAIVHGAPSMQKTTVANKNTIKKLDISAPVKSISFGRSQSMRSPSNEKAPVKRNGLASGSMRHQRPKNPPPPRPNNNTVASASNTTSSLRNIYANMNGDGSSSSIGNSTDNIYCVIEDVKDTPASSELLSEIVNEIESRNVDSIYSTTSKNPQINGICKVVNDQTTYENIEEQNTKTQLASNNPKNTPENNSLYMNTANLAKQQSPNDTSKMSSKSNVASIAKKLSTQTVPGDSKPVIATKPSVFSSKIETSQSDSTKKWNATRATNSNATKVIAPGKAATINPTSTVRAMHKRFEKRNA